MGAGAAIAIVASMALGPQAAVFLAVLVALAAAVASPFAGLAILVILLPLREAEVLPPIGPNLLLIAATAAGCLLRAPFERVRPTVGPGPLLLGAYLALSAASIPIAVSGGLPAEQATVVSRFLQTSGLAAIFVVGRYLLARTNPIPYLMLAVATTSFAASLGVLQALWGGPTGIPFRGILSPTPDVDWLTRVAGPFYDPNYFGFLLATGLLTGLSIISLVRWRWRAVLVMLGALLAVALVLTFSRSGLLATMVGCLVLFAGRSRRLASAFAALALVVAVVAYPLFLETRLDLTYGDASSRAIATQNASLGLRSDLIRASVQLFLSEPVFGVGYGRFQYESPRFVGNSPETFAHDVYGLILAEQGIVGGIMAAFIVAVGAWSLVRVAGPLRFAGVAMLATWMTAGLFLELTVTTQASSLAVVMIAASLASPKRGDARDAHAYPAGVSVLSIVHGPVRRGAER